ncbi:adenylosuccinate lyase, partial [Streptomyces coelicoflavus]|nr:adenylosuccinate lyase [Streptomyces coelicoflavus]
MDEELRVLTERLRAESAAPGPTGSASGSATGTPGAPAAYDRLVATGDHDELAAVLTEPGHPLWARELAAFRLGVAGDRRAFESLVLLLNHRDPPRCASAAHALARLGDPRTARAAA